ncbi:MAG: type II toxin-antitoxin system RelB/DinJ family antitoxin [Candidatus Pacebacteria bacterium]|nr:type II toxin-antitoxin system RelB/DinJ family antitoxin [Candidatus Paceibacterota bacterium]
MKTILNIKTDKDVKLGAKRAAEELGVPLGTIINAFLRQLARDKEVTFSVPYKPTAYLTRVLSETEREWKKGIAAGPFTLDELRKGLK